MTPIITIPVEPSSGTTTETYFRLLTPLGRMWISNPNSKPWGEEFEAEARALLKRHGVKGNPIFFVGHT